MALSYLEYASPPSNEKLGLVWNLFSDLGKQTPDEIINTSRNGTADRMNFSEELIKYGTTGKINLLQEHFKLFGYDYWWQGQDKHRERLKNKRELYLVSELDSSIETPYQSGYGEYSESNLAIEDPFPELEDEIDYDLAWKKLPYYQEQLAKVGFSLIYLLQRVLENAPNSKENLELAFSLVPDFQEWVEALFHPKHLDYVRFRLEQLRKEVPFS